MSFPPTPPEAQRISPSTPVRPVMASGAGPAPTVPPASLVAPVWPEGVQQATARLMAIIGDDEASEVLLNGPHNISRKVRGRRALCPEISFPDVASYHRVINEFILSATDTPDRIGDGNVIIEGQIKIHGDGRAPLFARVHVVSPPGVFEAQVTIAKKPRHELTLDDMVANGTVSSNAAKFLNAAARARQTIVISGPTGSGKTTILQALSRSFDPNDRIIVIEETPELQLPLGDVVYLRASLERPGADPSEVFDLNFWTKQANRMRMDRVIVGECRGGEIADWMLAANSGAEGSATTVHANNPRRALEKILSLALKSEHTTSEAQLRREIAVTIDLIVQLGLVNGRPLVTAIEEVTDTIAERTGLITTSTLFAYDKARGAHICKSRPSEAMHDVIQDHGVALDDAWWR